MNPEKWESVDSLDSSSGVMVSNLPLLFVSGQPISLQKMTVNELEVFVPFMVRCSVGEDFKIPWSQLPHPPWWPRRLPFRVPSTRNILVKLIERCYEFHGCQYLLQFCSSLLQMRPTAGYRFTDNRDGTMSMYHGNTGKLLVTFRNENREYDQQTTVRTPQSSQKKLLPSPSSNHQNGSHGNKSGVMVRPAVMDVFLCDKCDDEFSSLKEVQNHEKLCKGGQAPSTPKLSSPEPESSDEEHDPENQVPYLAYLGLRPGEHTGIQPYRSPRKRGLIPEHKFNQNYLRCDTVDVSSPLGKYLLSRSKCGKLQVGQQHVLRYERHVYAAPDTEMVATRERTGNRWVVVWRPRRDDQTWAHLYCFNSDQKKERQSTMRFGLTSRSRELLAECKGVKVILKRLAKRTIDRATRLGSRSAPCIDLTASEELSPSRPKMPYVVDLSNQSQIDPLALPFQTFSDAFEHSIFGRTTYPLPGDPLLPDPTQNLLTSYASESFISNGAPLPSSTQSTQSPLCGPYEDASLQLREKLVGFGVSVANIYDISSNKDDSSFYAMSNRDDRHSEQSRTLITHSPKQFPIYRKYNTSNSVHPSSSHCAKEGAYTTQCIEVIDLSSDEESPQESAKLKSSLSCNKGEQSLNNRSFARSKNGYSHWLPKESHPLKRRGLVDSATNGSAQSSVTSQPLSSCYHYHNSFSPKSFLLNELECGKRPCNSVIPRIALDEEVSIKASPLLFDDDIFLPSCDYEENILTTLHHRRKRLNYLKSMVESSFYDDAPNKFYGDDNSEPVITSEKFLNVLPHDLYYLPKENCSKPISPCSSERSRHSTYEEEAISKSTKGNRSSKRRKRRMKREIERLMEDECRELQRKGIGILRQIHNKKGKMVTRTSLGKVAPSLNTERSQFFILDPNCQIVKAGPNYSEEEFNGHGKEFVKSENYTTKEETSDDNFDENGNSSALTLPIFCDLLRKKSYRDGSSKLPLEPLQFYGYSSAGNNNNNMSKADDKFLYLRKSLSEQTPQYAKRFKLQREIQNLAGDECKELRDLGFHPSDILGATICPNYFQPGADAHLTPPPAPNRRQSLLMSDRKYSLEKKKKRSMDFEDPAEQESVKNMMQGNKRLSRELDKLMKDEWKEFRMCGSHPSQITRLLSNERSLRSLRVDGHDGKNPDPKEHILPFLKDVEWSLSRSTRGQSKNSSYVYVETPRTIHRNLLQAEAMGMCVVNYEVPKYK